MRGAVSFTRRPRLIAYSAVVLLLLALVVLGEFAAPCPNWKDGACESNWASEAQWLLLPVLVLAILAVMWCAMQDNRVFWRRLGRGR
jgi:hypothetical protein